MNGRYPVPNHPPAPRGLSFGQKKPSQADVIEKQVGTQIADIAGRVKIVEERIDTLRTHVGLIDNSLIEKHKTTVAKLNNLRDSMRSLRSDLDEVKDFSERIAKRMEALASKEQVKVLERYIDMWQPLKYIKNSELKAAMLPILKELGIKTKKH